MSRHTAAADMVHPIIGKPAPNEVAFQLAGDFVAYIIDPKLAGSSTNNEVMLEDVIAAMNERLAQTLRALPHRFTP